LQKKSRLVNSQGQSHKHSHAQKQQNDQTAEQRKLQPCLKKERKKKEKGKGFTKTTFSSRNDLVTRKGAARRQCLASKQA